jgi:hypothetical protein
VPERGRELARGWDSPVYPRLVLDSLAALAWRRPLALLGAAIALLAILVLTAAGVRDKLGHPDGAVAGEERVAVKVSGDGEVKGDVYRAALEVITAGIEARPDVVGVTSPKARDDEDTTVLLLDLGTATAAEERRLADGLAREVDPGPLEVSVQGRVATLLEAEDSALRDLWRLELLVVPLALLMLAAVLGVRSAAGPILCAGIAVCGALAGLGAAGSLLDLSLLGTIAAAGVGLVLGLELPALLSARWQDEVRLDRPETALRNVLADGGGLVGFAGISAVLAGAGTAVAAWAAGVFEPGLSAAIGIALAAGLAVAACLLVMPALFALDGRRDEEGPAARRDPRLSGLAAALPRMLARGGARTALGLAAVAVACLGLGYPALEMNSAPLAEDPARDFESSLPLIAAAGVVALLISLAARSRSARSAPLCVLPVLPVVAGLGVVMLAFDGSSPATGAIGVGISVIAAVSAARTAAALEAVRAERELDPGPPGVAERSAELTVPAALVGSVVSGAAFGVLAASELRAAQELGVLVAAGLVADLALRPAALAALARFGAPTQTGVTARGRSLRLGWPRWRRAANPRPETDSPS